MIRICKTPSIREYDDRWGRPTGEYYVEDTQGDVPEEMWEEIKRYESYYTSEEGIKEQEDLKVQMDQGASVYELSAPVMQSLITRAGGQLWQMNLRFKENGDESEYIRTFALFGEITLHVWTPEHDEKVKTLQVEVNRLNAREEG